MRCPWCEFEGSPRALHAHLAETHANEVTLSERDGRAFYEIVCPHCGDGYSHEIKPRGRDPRFAEEFRAQISLVAFDMLVNHLLVEHDPTATAAEEMADTPGTAGAPAEPAPPAPASGPAWLVEARRAARSRPDEGT